MSAVEIRFNVTFAGPSQYIGLRMVDPTTKKESQCPNLLPGTQLFSAEPGTEFRIYCGGLTYQRYLTTNAPVQNVEIVPSPDGGAKVVVPGLMTLNSTAFQDFGPIPSKYTCDGANISPPLAWSGVPAKARNLVLIVEDEDATDDDGFPLSEPRVHWVLYNIPPSASALPEGGPLPAGTLEGVNGSGKTGYQGPCRPSGQDYYVHKLLALDRVIPDLGRPSKEELLAQMRRDQSHVIAQADLVGTYQKP